MATSRDLNPENLHRRAALKGITVVGSGDYTHPQWLEELQQTLEPADEGLFRLKQPLLKEVETTLPPSCRFEVRFALTVEISSIYKKNGRTRKVHNIVILPDFDSVKQLNRRLSTIGNLKSDGRPILGLDSRDLLEICLEVAEDVLFIPAHIWTPYFSVLGSKSGFDSMEECFEDLLPHIFAVESGLSADPPMIRRVSALDRFAVISNSDAHSPQKLGREATCFDGPVTYQTIYRALNNQAEKGLVGTLEMYPQEGKYHLDGHRKCQVRWEPAKTRKAGGVCPECGRKLTIGVLHRVDSLADRAVDHDLPFRKRVEYIISLPDLISAAIGVGSKSKRVQSTYLELLASLGPELRLLREIPTDEITRVSDSRISEGVKRMRAGEVEIQPGYDGEFGRLTLF